MVIRAKGIDVKFEAQKHGAFWEVGFFNPAKKWVCLSSYPTQSEADEEVKRLIGGNKSFFLNI